MKIPNGLRQSDDIQLDINMISMIFNLGSDAIFAKVADSRLRSTEEVLGIHRMTISRLNEARMMQPVVVHPVEFTSLAPTINYSHGNVSSCVNHVAQP